MVAPFGLSAFYPRPEGGDFRSPVYGAAVIGLVVVSAAVVALRKRVRWLPAVWAAYLLVLAPHLGLIRVGHTIAADRYCYLASILWVIPLAGGLTWLGQLSWPMRVRLATVAAGLALIVGIACLSQDAGEDLARLGGALAPRPEMCARQLADACQLCDRAGREGRARRGRDRVRQGPGDLAQRPGDPGQARVIAGGSGQVRRGHRQLSRGAPLRPDDAMAYLNLGAALAARGQYDEAIAHVSQVPEHPARPCAGIGQPRRCLAPAG